MTDATAWLEAKHKIRMQLVIRRPQHPSEMNEMRPVPVLVAYRNSVLMPIKPHATKLGIPVVEKDIAARNDESMALPGSYVILVLT